LGAGLQKKKKKNPINSEQTQKIQTYSRKPKAVTSQNTLVTLSEHTSQPSPLLGAFQTQSGK
jgi:hypothetical protein